MFLFNRSLAKESIHFAIMTAIKHFRHLRDFKNPVFCGVAPTYVKYSRFEYPIFWVSGPCWAPGEVWVWKMGLEFQKCSVEDCPINHHKLKSDSTASPQIFTRIYKKFKRTVFLVLVLNPIWHIYMSNWV